MKITLTRKDLEDLRRLTVKVAGEAAGFLRDHLGEDELLRVEVVHGDDEGMRIDLESEKMVMELLSLEGIRGVFVGEEHGEVVMGDDPYVVVVDPLDGSRNYAAGIAWAAVNIAIALRSKPRPTLRDIVVGAIAPIMQGYSVYSFAKGLGAYEGGRRVSARGKPLSRLIFTYVERIEHAEVLYKLLKTLGGHRAIRALGSSSLEVVWTGMGRGEAFIDVRGRLRIVDVAASSHFAKEAGAKVLLGNPNAVLSPLERIGYVIVTAFDYVWDAIRKVLAFEDVEENLL
ncbi:MAG: inositol monophosphatase family protein [Pyrodictiaceae archaeon]